MITAYHPRGKVFWPNRCRIAVFLSFDFQGGEFVVPMANGKMNLEVWHRPSTDRVRAYGGSCAFSKSAASKPLSSPAGVLQSGTRRPCRRSPLMGTRSPAMVIIMRWRGICHGSRKATSASGRPKCFGWDGKPSRGVAHLHSEPEYLGDSPGTGYLWNSNSFQYDLPFVWESSGRTLIELPRQPYGDGWIYGGLNTAGDPMVALSCLESAVRRTLSRIGGGAVVLPVCDASVHLGRPGKAKVMADMIEYMQSHEGVWFATGSEVAEWWLTQNFSQVPLPRVSARAAGGARA